MGALKAMRAAADLARDPLEIGRLGGASYLEATIKSLAKSTSSEPTLSPGDDAMAVNAGRATIGFIERRDGAYLALDASGANLGAFRTRQEAFSAVLASARAKSGAL